MKLKVLSWNIWCGTYLREVIKFLKTADADIIALQEVVKDKRGNLAEIIAKKLKYKYVDAVNMNIPVKYLPGYKNDDKRTMKYGNAILSKYKIINSKIYKLNENEKFPRLIIRADIKIKNEILHIFSIHLKHTHQKPSELQDLELKNLLKLFSKKNTIMVGDFNALPESTVIQKMRKIMTDSELLPISTLNINLFDCPGCNPQSISNTRLDYIFSSKDLKSSSFEVYESKGSDHLPISVVVEI